LCAIKNVGSKAVDAIIDERRKNGPFASIFDLCRRVDLRSVNKAALESLIKAGAMDCLGQSRARLTAGVDRALQAGSLAQQDREKKQLSLFDAFDEQDNFRAEMDRLPEVPDWTESEQLSSEKDAVGFYLSKNPLSNHEEMLSLYSTIRITDLPAAGHEAHVVIGGMICNPALRVIKRGLNEGKRMANFRLEDFSGSCRAVVFADAFKKCGHMIEAGSMAFVIGTVDLKNNSQPEIRVEQIVSLAGAPAALTDHITISIAPELQQSEIIPKLRTVFDKHHGECTVFFLISNNGLTTIVRAGSHWRVKIGESLKRSVEELLREGCVEYVPRYGPTPLIEGAPAEAVSSYQ